MWTINNYITYYITTLCVHAFNKGRTLFTLFIRPPARNEHFGDAGRLSESRNCQRNGGEAAMTPRHSEATTSKRFIIVRSEALWPRRCVAVFLATCAKRTHCRELPLSRGDASFPPAAGKGRRSGYSIVIFMIRAGSRICLAPMRNSIRRTPPNALILRIPRISSVPAAPL